MSKSRDDRKPLQGWVSRRDHRIIQAAAGQEGMSVGEFVAAAALERAGRVLPPESVKRIDTDLKKGEGRG